MNRVEGDKGASSEGLWGRRGPGKEKEPRVWKAVCGAFLKFANTMYLLHVCVPECVCVCV